jgi:hypothetical protein
MESGHWYTRNGEPRHTQVCKPGAKNPTRNTNITDARKQDLLPSVSAYTKMLAADGLVRWQKQKVAEACLEAPYIGDEDKKEWINKILEASEGDKDAAAALGSKIHAALEAELSGNEWDHNEEIDLPLGGAALLSDMVLPAIQSVNALGLTAIGQERVLVNNREGYAGTTDYLFTNGILDYKSKRTKAGEKIYPSDSHPMQIAAYIMAHFGTLDGKRGINVYISTTDVGRVEVYEYTEAELKSAWEAFLACCVLYRYVNNYDARLIQQP